MGRLPLGHPLLFLAEGKAAVALKITYFSPPPALIVSLSIRIDSMNVSSANAQHMQNFFKSLFSIC